MKTEKTEENNQQEIPHSEVVAMMHGFNMPMALESPENKAKYLVDITNKFHKMYKKLKKNP